MKYTIAIIILVGAVLIAGYMDKPMNPVEKTLAVCNKAHTEASGFSENYCGQLQEENNLEYLCNYGGSECWIESK